MTRAVHPLALAWRQLRRDFAAGEVRILLAALVLSVVAVASVGFVTDRAARALQAQANALLGGDAVLRADAPIDEAMRAAARAPGLRHAETTGLDSMIRVGNGDAASLRLGELLAFDRDYPLRGAFAFAGSAHPPAPPARGTVWMTRAGADTLGARVGDAVHLGTATFRLAALVEQEPGAGFDVFNIAPRVFLDAADLPRTGLLQPGSRVQYRLIVAGDAAAVARFTDAARARLGRGQRLETIGDARPEMRSALDRAGRFLGLAALVAVVLGAIAVAMAARRHSARHLQAAAVMRSLGASQRTLLAIHLGELLWLGLLASAAGVAIAWGLQWIVGAWLSHALDTQIPPPSWWPALRGFAVGLVVLFAFAAPPVLALRRVPALRVLRHDLDPVEPGAWTVAIAGIAGLGALLWWQAGSTTLAVAMLLGLGIAFAALATLAGLLIVLVRRVRTRLRGSLRYGLANVARRPATGIAQVSALGLGLMALLLLVFVRGDLLDRWQRQLSQTAPNRFVINVQPDQVQPVRDFIAQSLPRVGAGETAAPVLFPMVRARLQSRNGKPASGADYAGADDARAHRLAEREFNLSSVATLRGDNHVVAGRFWSGRPARAQFSVEEKFAASLGWKVGDRIGFDIAGQSLDGTITSLRRVDWESFRPNFFVLASPGALDGYPASYVTAVAVPPSRPRFTADLVQRFPNLTVVDVDAVLRQVRATGDQVSKVVQVVFWFSFAAGLLVLVAAVGASQDERLREGGVMRALGASRRQLRMAQASEFAAIGLLAGVVAAIGASVLSGVVAARVFDLPWQPDWWLAVAGGAVGTCAALIAGLLATGRVLQAPPSVVLRELDG